jgi:hypothetical protein
MSITDNLTVAGVLIGKGEFDLTETNGEKLHTLAPKGSSPGFVTQLSCSVSDLNIPEDQGW